jgi:hypothetical protein
VKVRSQGRVQNKAIYPAFGVNLQGLKEVLGMWAADNSAGVVLLPRWHQSLNLCRPVLGTNLLLLRICP